MTDSPEELTVVIKCVMITSPLEKEPPGKKGPTVPSHPAYLGIEQISDQ